MSPASTKQPRFRLSLFAAIFCFWLFAICTRLLWLQVVQYGFLTQRAARQQQRSIEVAPPRGIVYDRKGRELAMSVDVDSVFAVPSEISDHVTTAHLLARVLKADPKEIRAKLESSHSFTWIARKVDNPTSARIHALNLKGIYFQQEPKRFYPKNELASQVLGYVGMDDEGLAGIERTYNQRLSGKPGKMIITMDAHRRWFGRVEQNPVPGQNLVLTIDEDIQHIAERELDLIMEQKRPQAATVIVENPHTGEILALANRPTFNPNNSRAIDPKALRNRAVSDIYEPGSTFKMVTISAAVDENVTRPEEVIDCQMGSIVVNGMRIHDWHRFGDLTVADILAHSSDVGSIKLGMRLGEDRLYKYIRAYGFGSRTGIELSGETRGITKPPSRWSKMSIGAISMGQEIGVSPIQLVAMTSTIANDGMWIAPRIVAGTALPQPAYVDPSSAQKVVFHPGPEHRVISALTAAKMRAMLEGVVLHGTGHLAALNGYTAAGKTGTAQKINPLTHRYDKINYIASFSGFAPINNPAITVTVIVDSPHVGSHEGGYIAPYFSQITQQVLEYLDVPHDIDVKKPQRAILRASAAPDNEGMSDHVGEALSENDDSDLAVADATPAPVSNQAIVPASLSTQSASAAPNSPTVSASSVPIPKSGTVVLDADAAKTVPSFLGKPVRAVVEESEKDGLEVDVFGSGIARDQSPAPGSRLPAGGHVTVQFAR